MSKEKEVECVKKQQNSENSDEDDSDGDYQSADEEFCSTPVHTPTTTPSEIITTTVTTTTIETNTEKQPKTAAAAAANKTTANATTIPITKPATNSSDEEYPLHKSVFEDDYKRLARMLQLPLTTWRLEDEIARKDMHGNTPLHLAVMLGRKECIQLLLAHGAPVKVKNSEGWSPLSEAISYGDRQTITTVLRKLKQQSRQHMEKRRAKLVRALRQMKDFYMELKWDFQSWVPLVSRILPSDICRIHKSGATLRLDTTLVDFNDMRWERGDISFIFRGELSPQESLIVLDNELECYQHVRYEDADMEDEVDLLMSTDILATQMSTKSIQFARAQSGWIFRSERKELVSGQYQCDLYTIQGLVLKQRKRREHLSHEDLQKNRAIVESITRGSNSSNSSTNTSSNTNTNPTETARRASLTTATSQQQQQQQQQQQHLSSDSTSASQNGLSMSADLPRRSSLQPPPAPAITWPQYVSAPAGKCPQLGRAPVHKQSNKTLRATVAMSRDFPLSVDMLLDVLEVIAPLKHINKLREFVTLKLPTGFPVKIEIPVLHTVTAKVTFQKFEFRDNIPEKLFEVPTHYWEDVRRFQDL